MSEPNRPHEVSRGIVAFRLVAALFLLLAVLRIPDASAIDLPPAGAPFYIQTNGPIGAATLGDWYSSNAVGAGAGNHYLAFNVPCGWPASKDVNVDLFSPEMNRVTGPLAQTEEPNGAYDSTQFELYGPGATVGPGFASPGPGTGIAGTQVTFEPGLAGVAEHWIRFATLAAPVTCGSYVIRSAVLTNDPLNPGGTGDDQNGWKARIGFDDDADPNDAPPANLDNPDGLGGTNDELSLGVQDVTFQHDAAGTVCNTFYQYVGPGQASVTFNNFDMDGNGRVRYYAPGDPSYDPTATTGGTVGTVSDNGLWNGGTLAARAGDSIANPTSGWWRLATCISSHNQLIQEGETGAPIYYGQPPTPALTLTKSDGQGSASPGDTLTYTVDVANAATGPTAGAANAVVVHDTIPANTTYQGCGVTTPGSGTWGCSESGGDVTFTQTGWLAAGEAAQLIVIVKVKQGAGGSIVNAATADYSDALGNVFPQVSASDTDTVALRSDLSITKTDSVDPVVPGQNFHYDITVDNAGPADATNVHVTDSVPPNLTVTGTVAGAGNCTVTGNDVDCLRGPLAVGGSWAIEVDVTVDPADPGGRITNTAAVSADQADPDASNDTASEDTTVGQVADVSITKTDSADPVDPGESFTYDLVVTNQGPADATNVVVNDPVPPGVTVTAADGPGGGCVVTGNDVNCTRNALADGATWTITVDATVDPGNGGGPLTNTATVVADQIDPDPSNNSSSQDTTVSPWADLRIQKTDSVDPVDPGQNFHYDLVVTNQGPADATNVRVTDSVPPGLVVEGTSAGAGSCTVTGNDVDCTRASLAVLGTWTIQVHVSVDPADPGGAIDNTASASADEHDPDRSDNDDTQRTTVRAVADLEIQKTDSADPVMPGDGFSYTLAVTNHGPAHATDVHVSDPVPAGFTVTGTPTGAGSCGVTGNAVDCTRAALASGGHWTITVDVSVDAGHPSGIVTNTASVSSDQADLDPTNDSSSQDTTVRQVADLRIRKTDSADPVVAGDGFTYDLDVTNLGPSDATNVIVADDVPAGLSVMAVRSSNGSCSFVGNAVSCERASLASGVNWIVHADVATSSSDPGTTYTNTAHVSADETDPDLSNNAGTQNTTVTGVADLEVVKTVDDAKPREGDRIRYTIVVTNHGPAPATGVVVKDHYPDGLTFVSAGPESGTFDGVTGRWDVGRLAVDATSSLRLDMKIDGGTDGDALVNHVSVRGDQLDPVHPNDDDHVSVTVSGTAGGGDGGGNPGPGGGGVQGNGGGTAATGADLGRTILGELLLLLLGGAALLAGRTRPRRRSAPR